MPRWVTDSDVKVISRASLADGQRYYGGWRTAGGQPIRAATGLHLGTFETRGVPDPFAV